MNNQFAQPQGNNPFDNMGGTRHTMSVPMQSQSHVQQAAPQGRNPFDDLLSDSAFSNSGHSRATMPTKSTPGTFQF